MIEKILVDFLSQKLTVPVGMEIPEEPKQSFVTVEKTGGGRVDYLHCATVAIQSYGSSLYAAAELNEQVKEAMDSLTERDEISLCERNTDYNFTDTTQKRYRYQAVFDITHY